MAQRKVTGDKARRGTDLLSVVEGVEKSSADAASRLGSICGGRKLGAKSIGFDFAALPGWRAAQWVDDLVGAADLVIIDAASHAEAYVRITARAARLVAVPVQPSPLRSVGDRQVRSGLAAGGRWIRTLGPREDLKVQGPQFHADYPPIGWTRKQRMKRMLNGFKRYGITCPAQTRCQPDRLI